MKKVYIAIIVLTVLLVSACLKRAPLPTDLDYYKNKIIKLKIENVDFGGGDYASLKIGTTKVDPNSTTKPRISVNGEEITGDFFVVGSSLIADGPVMIETLDSAWQLVIEYDLKADASKYFMTLSPYFNEVAADPIIFEVRNTKPKTGILEIKEYKNQ